MSFIWYPNRTWNRIPPIVNIQWWISGVWCSTRGQIHSNNKITIIIMYEAQCTIIICFYTVLTRFKVWVFFPHVIFILSITTCTIILILHCMCTPSQIDRLSGPDISCILYTFCDVTTYCKCTRRLFDEKQILKIYWKVTLLSMY